MARRGAALVPLVLRTSAEQAAVLLARGVYWCTVCQQELPTGEFLRHYQRPGQLRSRCRSCRTRRA
ncbi:hypothetical protein [Streptomyces sp. NPDC001389]|uniref:hypothetical protein n=1 Tax=Streptomyces sp. NPDC001389 TaxID=3364569 RepID=UPI00369CF976